MSAPSEAVAGGARVLVVDDIEVNRDLLARRLQRMGHVVGFAENGQDAVDLALAETWDLILLDVMMPVLDGIGALTQLKADARTRDIPVIMVSANTEIDSVVQCIELGADDYLPKPFNPVLLRARVGSSLEKKRWRDRERIRAERMQRDLEVGARIQRDFLPESLPHIDGYEFAARFEPAREVGGDFYDAFPLPDGTVTVVLGDVCDKGVGPALFMALFRSLIRAMTASFIADAGIPVAERMTMRVQHAVSLTNNYIANTHGRANMFATLFVGALDPATGCMVYINGGHEPPRVLATGGGVRALLPPTGPAVGMLPDLPFVTSTITLARGETLFVLTDGVTEARAPDGRLLGDHATDALLVEPVTTVSALLDRILAAVAAHALTEPASDDITMIAVRRM